MAVNNCVPAPFSKMSTNVLRTLSNTLISSKVRKQLWKQVLLHMWRMQQISNRNSDVPFASILCCLTTHDFSFIKGLIFQSKPYRMTRLTRLIQTIQLFVRCELCTFKTFFAEVEVLFGSHKPEILSVGRGPMKLNKLGDFDWCCFALLNNCQVDSWVVRCSNVLHSAFNVEFAVSHWDSTGEDGSEHFSGHKSRHLTLWGFLFAVSQLPEMIDVSDLKYKSLPFVWRNHPKPHLMPQTAFKHLQCLTALLIWGGKGRKGVAIEMWRRQNACSDRCPSARHTGNTTDISTLPSGRLIVDHAIEFSKPCVRMHYRTLQR